MHLKTQWGNTKSWLMVISNPAFSSPLLKWKLFFEYFQSWDQHLCFNLEPILKAFQHSVTTLLKRIRFLKCCTKANTGNLVYTVYESQSQFLVPNALKVLYLFWAHFLPNKNPFSTCHSNSAMLKLILPK